MTEMTEMTETVQTLISTVNMTSRYIQYVPTHLGAAPFVWSHAKTLLLNSSDDFIQQFLRLLLQFMAETS